MSISKTCLGKISSYFNTNFQIMEDVKCSLFHKTLPKSSLPMHWISVRFIKWAIYQTCILYIYFS